MRNPFNGKTLEDYRLATKEEEPQAVPSINVQNLFQPLPGMVSISGNHVWFYKEVSQASAAELVLALKTVERELRSTAAHYGGEVGATPIHLHIHSNGGSLFAGLAVLDTILACSVPVHTHIEGGAASAATIISVGGDHRTIGRNSFMLIHQLSNGHFGKYHDLKDGFKNNDILMKRMYQIYQKHAGLKKKRLKKILKKDLWFDAEKCLELGLVDEIV